MNLNKENQNKIHTFNNENKILKEKLKLEKEEFEEINSSFDVIENQLIESNKTNKILQESVKSLKLEINHLKENLKRYQLKRNNEGESSLFSLKY